MTVSRRLRLAAICLVSAGSLHRAAPSPGDEPRAADGEVRATELVSRLGSPRFDVRAEASKQILDVGLPAIPALEAAASNPSLEVRRRAERLLVDLGRRLHEQKLTQLKADPERTPDDFLPGLKRFRETVGRDAAATGLFLDMCRAEPDLFRMAEAPPREVEQEYDARSADVQFEINVLQSRSRIADRVAALLFIAAHPDLKESDIAANVVYSLAHQNEFRQSLTNGPQAPFVKKVTGQWIRKAGGVNAYQKLSLALSLDIPDGIHPAVEMIKRPAAVGGQAQFAVLAVARFGGKEHIPLVEKLLADKTLLSTTAPNNKVTYTCEMRDVALAALLHLTGQDPKGYGFSQLQRNPQWVFSPNTAGFAKAEDREAAISKWAEWRKANLPEG